MDEDFLGPESHIDGAIVLEWAWSGKEPFGVLPMEFTNEVIEIFALALCRYEGDDRFYRFSCDRNWVVQNDMDYPSLEEARNSIPAQYDVRTIRWTKAR